MTVHHSKDSGPINRDSNNQATKSTLPAGLVSPTITFKDGDGVAPENLSAVDLKIKALTQDIQNSSSSPEDKKGATEELRRIREALIQAVSVVAEINPGPIDYALAMTRVVPLVMRIQMVSGETNGGYAAIQRTLIGIIDSKLRAEHNAIEQLVCNTSNYSVSEAGAHFKSMAGLPETFQEDLRMLHRNCKRFGSGFYQTMRQMAEAKCRDAITYTLDCLAGTRPDLQCEDPREVVPLKKALGPELLRVVNSENLLHPDRDIEALILQLRLQLAVRNVSETALLDALYRLPLREEGLPRACEFDRKPNPELLSVWGELVEVDKFLRRSHISIDWVGVTATHDVRRRRSGLTHWKIQLADGRIFDSSR